MIFEKTYHKNSPRKYRKICILSHIPPSERLHEQSEANTHLSSYVATQAKGRGSLHFACGCNIC